MSIWAGSAVSKFAEWVASAVVGELVSAGYSYLRKRSSEAKLKRLETDLPQITAVMGVAEALKMKEPRTSEWVEQFRRAVEESQQVLNELECKNDDEAGEPAASSKKRKRCTISDGTLKRLKDAVTLLVRATTNIKCLLQLATALGVSESRQYTNKILRQEIKICVAEIERFRCTELLVTLPHLELSYFESNVLCPPTSLTRFPYLESCHILSLEVGGYTLASTSTLQIESRKWLNPLSEIENLKTIRLMQNDFTLSMAASRFVSLMNNCNISISTADLLMVFLELRTSLEKKGIKIQQAPFKKKDTRVLVMQNRTTQISLELALNWPGHHALHIILRSPSDVLNRFERVTSSDVEELTGKGMMSGRARIQPMLIMQIL